MKPRSRGALWAIWFVLVFGLLNIYGPGLRSYQPAGQAAMTDQEIVETMTPAQILGVILRNDTDTGRYLSYANAILGRPYAAYYVRPMEQWTHAEEADAAGLPSAIVTPDRPLLPWRDFSVEYPPGMLIAALLPALLTADKDVYHLLFSLEMGLLLTLTVWLTVRTAERLAPERGRDALIFSILFIAGVGIVSLRRYDAVLALALAAAIHALAARKPVASGLALAVGIVVKGVPVLLAPIGLAWFAAQKAWAALARAAVGSAVLLAAALGLYLLLAGSHAGDVLAYHGGRPLEIESTYGAVLMLARLFDPDIATGVYSFGSQNIVSPWEPALRQISGVAPILGLIGVYAWCWTGLRRAGDDEARLRILFAATAAVLVVFVVLGKVFSPQYMVWLLPVGTLAAISGSRQNRLLLLAACLLTQLEFPFAFTVFSGDLDPRLGLLVLARNGILGWWAVLTLIEATRPAEQVASIASCAPAPSR
ncbi:glycosyltransferase 87 family protein [Rhodoblastus sp.]|uniref:glycosyltransferase 87 family protein n=1 Tax=Rhodoblastus sp. TaxID=1962975 RepID=UPI0035B0E263